MSPESPFARMPLADPSTVTITADKRASAAAAFTKCADRHGVTEDAIYNMMVVVIKAGYGRNAYNADTLRALADLIESDVPRPEDSQMPIPPTPDEQIATKIDQIIRELFA